MATMVSTDVSELTGEVRVAIMRLARRLRAERHSDQLTLGQWAALGTLQLHGAMTVGDLAGHERVRPPSMTRIVNSLVKSGHVIRQAHPDDGRQTVIQLTEHAHAELAADRDRRNEWLANRLRDLTVTERKALERAIPLLHRLASE